MPPHFEVPIAPVDVWVPLEMRTTNPTRFAHTLRVVARAAPGADAVAIAARDLEAVAAQLSMERPGENGGWSVTVLPLSDVVVSPEFRRALWIVAGAVLFVLLMASTSVAALLLTRASGRQTELAVRVALGASRGSLVRLLLLESLVLGVVAGLAGLLFAYGGVMLLQAVGTTTVPRLGTRECLGPRDSRRLRTRPRLLPVGHSGRPRRPWRQPAIRSDASQARL